LHPDNPSAGGRACAREASTEGPDSAVESVELENAGPVSIRELEKIADAIETAEPRAGDSIKSIIGRFPQIRHAVVANAVRCLNARKWWWDAKKKRRIEEPDFNVVFRACEFLADRSDGRPVSAAVNFNLTPGAGAPSAASDDMPASPATIEALERMLIQMKRRAAEPRATAP
jgi:hypothetical protein